MDSQRRKPGRPPAPVPDNRRIDAENEAVRAHLKSLPAGPRTATELHEATGIPQQTLSYLLHKDPAKRRDLNAAQLDALYVVLKPNWPACPSGLPPRS